MLRGDRWAAASLAGATLLAAWGLTAVAGLVGVPRTDDWGFAREAYSLHAGHLRLINWGPMTKIGLLLWAQPFLWIFGDHHWALAIAVSILVATGLIAGFRLARLRVQTLGAIGVVGSLLLFPGVVRDTSTFMTDPPALALQLITLAFGALALEADGQRRTTLLVASMFAGLWAFSIRELALAAPLAVVVATVVATDRARRRTVLGVGGAFCLLAGSVWWWHHGRPGVEAYRGHPAPTQVAILAVSCAITVGLALVPALALSLPRWWSVRHRTGRLLGALVGSAVVAARPLLAWKAQVKNWWLVGDYLQADGVNGGKMLIGYRPTVLNDGLWRALIGLALVATVLCSMLLGEWAARWCTAAGRRQRSPDPVRSMVAWHATFAAAVLLVAAVWNGVLFDRYTWSLIFSGSWLLLCRPAPQTVPRRLTDARQVVATVAVVVAFGTTLLLTVNSAAFDRARWHAAQQAVAAGTPADEVDGGIEWDGAHSSTVNVDGLPTISDPLVSWWSHMTAMPRVCIVVTASSVDSPLGSEIRTVQWRPWLIAGRSTLHVYRLRAPACP